MIAAISMMRRRPDLSLDQFRKHWLDPHGVMTAELPGTRYYVQSHCIAGPGTNALALELAIDGFPELWYDSYEARRIAYTSPRIAECNIDSEQFVGEVSRLVTEPEVVKAAPESDALARVFVIATGTTDNGWAERLRKRVQSMRGIAGYQAHRILEQAAAPNSKIAELKVAVSGVAKVAFENEAGLVAGLDALSGDGEDAARAATYRVRDHVLVPLRGQP